MAASHATFVFADIAGFTTLTEAHGDEQAVSEAVRAELPAGAAHVKTIGDALMLRVPHPSEAILVSLNLTHGLFRGHGAPAVRVGLHHGPAVERPSHAVSSAWRAGWLGPGATGDRRRLRERRVHPLPTRDECAETARCHAG